MKAQAPVPSRDRKGGVLFDAGGDSGLPQYVLSTERPRGKGVLDEFGSQTFHSPVLDGGGALELSSKIPSRPGRTAGIDRARQTPEEFRRHPG